MATENHERYPVTHEIIGATFEVYWVPGDGFLEKVYRQSVFICVGLWLY
jgi:hypothetical protein